MKRNSLCDVPGLSAGHAHDATICTGVSVVIPDVAATAAVDIRGGAPGSRETDAVSGRGLIEGVHALVLSGGSAFGLGAASAVQKFLLSEGKGFEIGGVRVPIVPQLILFDLLNGGSGSGNDPNVYMQLADVACRSARDDDAGCGSVGAGFGATTATLRGGLGQASTMLTDGSTVAVMVAVNAVGSVTVGEGRHFWAAPFERDGEYGGLGLPDDWQGHRSALHDPPLKGWDRAAEAARGTEGVMNTTIGIVATDVDLDHKCCHRMAAMANTGLARAIHPAHTPLDGDGVFAISTAKRPYSGDPYDLARLGSAAADCMARAVARAVYEAAPVPAYWTRAPSWRERFGGRS